MIACVDDQRVFQLTGGLELVEDSSDFAIDGGSGSVVLLALRMFDSQICGDRKQCLAVNAGEGLVRNVAKGCVFVLGDEIVGHLRMRRVRVGISDEEKERPGGSALVGIMGAKKTDGLVGEQRGLEAFGADLFSIVGELLLARVRVLVDPVAEPGIEARMGDAFFAAMPFADKTGVVSGVAQQLGE